jgi:uncharacterized protein (DUF305 family)
VTTDGITSTSLPSDADPSATDAPRRLLLRLLVALAVAVAAAAAYVFAAVSGVERVDDRVTAGFIDDMTAHHAQAVEMSQIVHARTDDPQLRYLAFDTLSTQQGQIGIMTGWSDVWQLSPVSGDTMAWMGHEVDGLMPGMATREQVHALETLPVPEMEEQFLRLMIEHHRGALPMAEYAAKHSDSPRLRTFAQNMYDGQASEIDLMQDMLAARGLAEQGETATPHDGH